MTITGIGVSVAGKLSTISGGSKRVGEGVIEDVGVLVGVSVGRVGVKVGGAGVFVLGGIGVRLAVRVGVNDLTGVLVRVGVLVAVAVGVC